MDLVFRFLIMRSVHGILIADDLPVARIAIRALLDSHSIPVIGEAQNGKEAVEEVTKLRPDLVLLDINMPEMDSILAAYEIRRISPATKIVFLTIHHYPPFVEITRMLGHGCVPKAAAGSELIPTLQRLLRKLPNRSAEWMTSSRRLT